MEYSESIIKAATKIFFDGIARNLTNDPIYPRYNSVEEISEEDKEFEVESFLDSYCCAFGNKDTIVNELVGTIEEEQYRRFSHFECSTAEDEAFIKTAINNYLLNDSATFYKCDSLFSSAHDIIGAKLYSCEDENGEEVYFLMMFETADFDYELLFDGEYEADDYPMISEAIEKIKNH